MQNNAQSQEHLATMPVGKLLRSLAIPAITAQIINLLYNIVDRIYIGRIEGIGADALTGVGVTMPIIMAISAFAALISMGGAPRAAIALGRKDEKGANRILGNSFTMLLIITAVLTVVLQLFGRDLLLLFGASENTIVYAWDYMSIYSLGTIFVQLALGLNMFITTQGYAKTSMMTVTIGAISNIILDPIFIFVFGMGVQGAALATVISQGVSTVFVLRFLTGEKSTLRIKKSDMRLDGKVILPGLALGLSPFIMYFTEAILSVCFNTSLLRYGGDVAVGSMTILASVMQFAMLPLTGLTQGAQPIIGYNYGAGKIDRVKDTFRILLIVSLSVSCSIWALSMLFPGMLAAMFTPDEQLIEYASWAMRIYMGASLLFGAQIACQNTFVALGYAKISLFLALLRKVILLIPLIFILPNFFDNKVMAVFLAEPVSDSIAAITTTICFFISFRKLLKKSKTD